MNSFKDLHKLTIDQIKDLLYERMPQAESEMATSLARYYFQRVSLKDLEPKSIDDNYGALLCLWQFIQQRPVGQALVRAYNPEPEEHHWHSTHSIVEVLVEDMPFLVASILMELDRQEVQVHNLTHPVIKMQRDEKGQLISLGKAKGHKAEAVMRIEVDRQPEEAELQRITSGVHDAIEDVRRVVSDWALMQKRLHEAMSWCKNNPMPIDKNELEETLAFLDWLQKDNFLFVGFRYYEFDYSESDSKFLIHHESGLGTFKELHRKSSAREALSSYLSARMQDPELLVITKSTSRSSIQRPAHLDYLGIKKFNNDGQVIGEWRFFGLFSSSAYNQPLHQVPLIRKKVALLLKQADAPADSHRGKSLLHVIHAYPRDEMLQASYGQLKESIMGILDCQERRQLRVFLRPDTYDRFVNVLVYVPRDHFNTALRLKMQQILLDELDGNSIDFNVQLSENPLAQLQFTVHCQNANELDIDVEALEAIITEEMLTWQDYLQQALLEAKGEAVGNQLDKRYASAFPAAYREDVHPRQAIADIDRLQQLTPDQPVSTCLYRPVNDYSLWHFRVAGQGEQLALSDVLPILEKMGVRVLSARPYAIKPKAAAKAWVQDFSIAPSSALKLDDHWLREQFQDVFVRTWRGELENDGFNGLVVSAGLNWQQVVLLRALAKYLLQLQVPFSQSYMQRVLNTNSDIVKELVSLFEIRFKPNLRTERSKAAEKSIEKIHSLLEEVANLDEDRILRHFLSVIIAMQRTNSYQKGADGAPKSYLSFKLRPDDIPAAPLPRPMFEIFVYSPQVEGIHMRGGKIARGGLRWSDRREDFRTEILGLVKAQMVKNAVIVPHGAKGGFIPKQLPVGGTRDEVLSEGISSYKTFISGLLDVTDNLYAGNVQPPEDVIRHDEDDPYLVVAADKGTAAFSDIANEVSAQYDFWLGDAFASGGSQGYDHKKMGITARGAWESVKRVFKEKGHDTQQEDFTVIGIGDMSGDVFGNGMLLSEHIRLVAAFNHMHIFIDPNPDAKSSFVERQRLFKLPRSSWEDYDKSLISTGGGIYSRQAKRIRLSAEAKKALGITKGSMAPSELIQMILRAPADLLWNGGIGTYVKASDETQSDVGDRTNDSVRINASELRVKAVGEGGNLGLTQKARVEFSLRDGLINTDAVDNSGGVDSSDHEVNIKILLNQIVAAGDMTIKQRNKLLAEMTDEVAALVLRHNYLQSQRLSLSLYQSYSLLNDHRYLIRKLEEEGRLNRELECLPSESEIKNRYKAGGGLSRPEISVLLSHTKLRLFEALVASEVDKDQYLAKSLLDYFPTPLQKKFAQPIYQHPLKTEILATHLTNYVGNRMGSTFIEYLQLETRSTELDCVRAFMVAKEIFSIQEAWDQIELLGNSVDDDIQRKELIRIQRHVEKACIWLLRNHGSDLNIDQLIQTYKPSVDIVAKHMVDLLGDSDRVWLESRADSLEKTGMSRTLAESCAGIRYKYFVLFMVGLTKEYEQSIEDVARVYFLLEERLSLPWLREQIRQLPTGDLWQRKAQLSLRDQLDRKLTNNCAVVVSGHGQAITEDKLIQWLAENESSLDRWESTITDIQAASEQNLAMLSVAVQELSLMAS
ncbi:hypothetical protein ACH42_16175 [Endozoicomonas sp. (ex Bugula neritina AB1)]|nr:hypothetical protein ACH42_16175 [Endozoicomonas sp. (ex Bugula neritina AB1)]